MAGSMDVLVRFVGDSSQLTGEVGKVESAGNKLKSWAKGIGVALGAAFVVREVKDFVNAAEEAEVASRRLAQTLKNAGDEGGKWAKHAENLATSLMKQTGIDDEVIKGGQAILATFHAVGGQVGQSSGAFDRATKAALDLSKTGFGDVDSAAKALGKALQDPEKGLTALRRSGVNFTEAQKEQIKAMNDAGDSAGAMNLILGEVEKQVGGVAEKTATSGDKMKTAFNETKESIGKALLPVLQQLAPILQSVAQYVQENANWLVPLAAAIIGVVAAIKIWIAVQTVIDALLAANPIGLVVIAIAAIIAAIILLAQYWDQVWSWIANAPWYLKVVAAILFFASPIAWLITAIAFLASHWEAVWQAISDAVTAAGDWIEQAFKDVVDFLSKVPTQIANAFSQLWSILTSPFVTAYNFIAQIPSMIGSVFRGLVSIIESAVSGVVNAITSPFQTAWNIVQGIWNSISSVVGWVSDAIGAAKSAWNSFVDVWNKIEIKVPGVDIPLVGEVGGFTVGLPDLPHLAAGGIVTKATLALVGETGPEAVIPLSRMPGGDVNVYEITVNVAPGTSPAAVGAALVDSIRQYERVAGSRWRAS